MPHPHHDRPGRVTLADRDIEVAEDRPADPCLGGLILAGRIEALLGGQERRSIAACDGERRAIGAVVGPDDRLEAVEGDGAAGEACHGPGRHAQDGVLTEGGHGADAYCRDTDPQMRQGHGPDSERRGSDRSQTGLHRA